MKSVFSLFVCLMISVVSFGQDKTAPTTAVPDVPPGPSMKETEKWIKREIPNMGRDSVVEAVTAQGKTFEVETNYEIAKATLTDCTLRFQSIAESWGNQVGEMATVTMKDVDLSRLVSVEATPYGDHRASKASYIVRLVAQQDPNKPRPFTTLLTGYAGGPTTREVAAVNVRLRDSSSANQVATVFRRAAVLCGAPDRPVDEAALVACETIGSQVYCRPQKTASANTEIVTTKPSGNPQSRMTNDSIILMVKNGISDQIIITSIRLESTKDYDLTPTGLIALKKDGVSDAVIAAMQEKVSPAAGASEPKTTPKIDPTLAEPKRVAVRVPQDSCSGIESLGLYKNEVMSGAMGGGLVEWLGKIRNNTTVTKIVVFGWRDMYGQQQKAQVQIRGGDIATPRLDMTQARVIPPVADLRILSCQ